MAMDSFLRKAGKREPVFASALCLPCTVQELYTCISFSLTSSRKSITCLINEKTESQGGQGHTAANGSTLCYHFTLAFSAFRSKMA